MRAVEDWLKMYVHPTGIRLFVGRETEKAAQAMGDEEVAGWANDVVVADMRTQELELEWLGKKDINIKVRDRAMQVDNQVDAALGSLYNHFVALRDRLPVGHPEQMVAAALIKDVFPKGVKPIVTLPFEEEHSAIESIIARLSSRYRVEITTLGAGLFFEYLVETQAEYGEVLSVLNSDPMTFNEVKMARVRGKALYAAMVVRILAKYFDDEVGRGVLMKTVEDQEERIGVRNKRRYGAAAKGKGTGGDGGSEVGDSGENGGDDVFDEFDEFDENYDPGSGVDEVVASE